MFSDCCYDSDHYDHNYRFNMIVNIVVVVIIVIVIVVVRDSIYEEDAVLRV